MRKFPRPCLVSSKCIEFEACRYNGLIIKSSLVEKLKNFADFIPVCPEVEIGLGIPRDPIHLEENNDQIMLIQPSTGADFTENMEYFADSFLNSIEVVDGFILKNKSPSCGIKAVKVYPPGAKARPRTDGVGLFARKVFESFPYLPVEDEGRLRNLYLRENYLTRIYTLAEFRENVENGDFASLVNFHRKNKLLFLSYSQTYTRKLGRLVANSSKNSLNELIEKYKQIMRKMLVKDPLPPANINVLMHAMGHFSKDLHHQEKSFFLESLEKYRQGRVPLLVTQNLLKSWIIRFNNEYLSDQTFFEPYPDELMEITFI
ncbi:MAG: DUF1722 domain-containing protein [Methanobacteriaceae archaeon]|nr:DUF1722 domain-containing protein [Methanobacteriaceae archaeon]